VQLRGLHTPSVLFVAKKRMVSCARCRKRTTQGIIDFGRILGLSIPPAGESMMIIPFSRQDLIIATMATEASHDP
jgi:hypothetical protein